MKLIKYLFVMIFSIVLIVVLGIQALYFYKVSELDLEKVLVASEYPQGALDALWVSLGESTEQKIYPIGALEYSFKLATLVSSSDISSYKQVFAPGYLLSSHVAKSFVVGKTDGNTDWHLSNIMSSIWVSNNYTAEEALNYQLEKLYFGYNKFGLESAATFYFGKAPSDLNEMELVTLIAITKGPSIFSPYCSPVRLEEWGREITKGLKIYEPNKYKLSTYKVPDSFIENGIKCHLTNASK